MGQSAKGRLSVPKPGALPQFWENPEWSGGVPVNRPNDDSGSVRRGRICSALFFIFNSDSSFLRSEAHCECCFVKKFWRSASLLTLLHSRDGSASQVHETRRHGSSRAPARLSSGMPCSWRKIRRESLHFGTNAPQRAPVGFLEVFIFLASKDRYAGAEFMGAERLCCGQPFQSGHKVHNLSARCRLKGGVAKPCQSIFNAV